MYITDDGIIITGIFDGNKIHPEGKDVPETFQGVTGDKLKLFDSDWNVRPFIDLISEGLVDVPEGYKLENGTLKELTEKECNEKKYVTNKDVYINSLCSKVDDLLNTKYFKKEITFKNRHVRIDQISKRIIDEYIMELFLGARSYPITWITCENDTVTIDNAEELKSLTQQMSAWVENSILACRETKNKLQNAKSFDSAWIVYNKYRNINTQGE